MGRGITFIVQWKANSDSFWELGENCHHVTLRDMIDIYGGESLPEIRDLEGLDEEDQDSLDQDIYRHLETLRFWEVQLDECLDAEEDIQAIWALTE